MVVYLSQEFLVMELYPDIGGFSGISWKTNSLCPLEEKASVLYSICIGLMLNSVGPVEEKKSCYNVLRCCYVARLNDYGPWSLT